MTARRSIVVGIVVLAVIAIWYADRRRETSRQSATRRDESGAQSQRGGATSAPASPALGDDTRESTATAQQEAARRDRRAAGARTARATFDARVTHTADPCLAVGDPAIPPGYERVVEGGITVAWSPRPGGPDEAPWRPLAIAHLVAGLLEEAARLTTTERRAELTVIVDPSESEFRTRSGAPAWATGLYDGDSIHVYLRSGADLAVSLPTLRHEVMHAQLHVAVGCAPFWFHEGLATYFAGAPPLGELFALLRGGGGYDLDELREPVLHEQAEAQVGRAYAMSLAMILYFVDGNSDRQIVDLVQAATSAESRVDALGLWPRVAPGIDERAVRDALARDVFGLSLGSELESALTGPLCCRGVRDIDELRCRRPTEIVPNKTQWLDASTNTLCRTSW